MNEFKFMNELAEKLFAEREKQAPVKPDYTELLKAVFYPDDEPDSALNDSAELAEAVNKALSALPQIERYCMEEKYLHGKSDEQLADEFRKNLDMDKFAAHIVKDAYRSVKNGFVEKMELIFRQMEDNSFRELEYIEGMHPENLPKNDTYYEPDADKSVLDILRYTLGTFDGMGLSYKEIFENCYMKGQTNEELTEWIAEHMKEYVYEKCCAALRKLRIHKNGRALKKFIADSDSRPEYGIRQKDECRKCIYTVTHEIGEQPGDCSACRTDEVRKWLEDALSELPSKKRQVIRSLYDLEDGHCSMCGRKETAVKLRLESKEYVAKLEISALKALRKKALRELLTNKN